jgi:hypothetical protein
MPRADLNTLSSADRTKLADLILSYLDDEVVAANTTIIHNDVHIFTGHRIYIEGLQTVGQNAENEPNPVALPDPYSNTLSGKRPEVHVEPPVAASNTLTRI